MVSIEHEQQTVKQTKSFFNLNSKVKQTKSFFNLNSKVKPEPESTKAKPKWYSKLFKSKDANTSDLSNDSKHNLCELPAIAHFDGLDFDATFNSSMQNLAFERPILDSCGLGNDIIHLYENMCKSEHDFGTISRKCGDNAKKEKLIEEVCENV